MSKLLVYVQSKVIIEKSGSGRFLWKISEVWAGFGRVGITEKNGPIKYEQLLSAFFHVFLGIFLKHFLNKAGWWDINYF